MRLSRCLAVLAVALAAPAAFAQPGTTGEPLPPRPQPEDTTMPPPPPDPNVASDPMQPAPPPPPTGTDVAPTTNRSPGSILPNMLPTRVGATVDFRGDYSHFAESEAFFGETLLSFDLYGQYIWPEGYGGYIQLPYAYASGGEQESQQGVGNIEIGGLYKVPTGRSEVLLRGGIALDSAGQIDSLLNAFARLSPRLYDAYPTGLLTNWLRAEGSLRHSEGNLRLAASLGADVPFGGDDDFNIEIDMLAKLAVSAGFENPGGAGVAFGFVMLQAVGADGDDDDNTIFGLNATVSFPVSPTMSMYGAFGLPDLENNIDEFDLFAIGAGVRAAIN